MLITLVRGGKPVKDAAKQMRQPGMSRSKCDLNFDHAKSSMQNENVFCRAS